MNLTMATMPEWFDSLVLAIGWALVLFLAQGLIIGLGVAMLLRALRRRSADLRYSVALVGLLLMVACPVVTTFRGLVEHPRWVASRSHVDPIPSPTRTHVDTRLRSASDFDPAREVVPGPTSEDDGTEPTRVASAPRMNPRWDWRTRLEAWLPAAVALWLLGVSALSLRLALGLVEIRGLTRRGIESPSVELLAVFERLLERLGCRRPVRCFLSRRVEVPSVVGWIRPTVLIPVTSLARLTVEQLEALLAHELAHVRRLDFLVNACQVVVEALLFFHPAVWWVSGRIRVEREHCCDDLAVDLCGGNRLLVARTLFTLEELRSTPAPGLAATGGSLRDRVRRLVLPASANPSRGDAGWAGAGLMAVMVGIIAVGWTASVSLAQAEAPTHPEGPRIRGRVLDGKGKPVEGARVRLYERDGRWEHLNKLVEETKTSSGGAFQLHGTPESMLPSKSRQFSRRVLLADHPGHAVGWLVIPDAQASFQGDLILTEPIQRTVTVIDSHDQPVEGATVAAYGLGDPSSPSLPHRKPLALRVQDGPLAAITDAKGRAILSQLPQTNASFVATKPGYAEGYAFHGQGTIHLSPAASLNGTVTGPDGEPLAGVKVVLYTGFMWSFERGTTDDQGRYRFDGLKARGWDMSAWRPGQTGNGTYKVWIEAGKLAAVTQTITLDPGEPRTLDIQAKRAGLIRVTLVEQGTRKPVAGARIWGFDKETGSSARFDATTDEQGRATFYSLPAAISLSVAGPPEGTYIDGDVLNDRGANTTFDFPGGAKHIPLTMPPITGRLINVSGICTNPDGSPASGVTVHVEAGRFQSSTGVSNVQPQRSDGEGRFTLEEIPSGQRLGLYAESEDGRLAGTISMKPDARSGAKPQVKLPLRRTVKVGRTLENVRGGALASREFSIMPKVQEGELLFLRRLVKSDEQGRVEVDRVLPGLIYHIQEEGPILEREIGGMVRRRNPEFDKDLILAPE